ncbi:MAG: ATP-binding protein [Lentisphaerae bacterium]|nr:ATP-binding protein [Lentisphaerota bacterium]
MTFTVKNVGPITDISIKLNKLTMLCGKNNSGKTYLLYAMHSLLSYIRRRVTYEFSDADKENFCNTGRCSISVRDIVQSYASMFNEGFKITYSEVLARDLALPKSKTESSEVFLSLDKGINEVILELITSESRSVRGRYTKDFRLCIGHDENSENVVCEYLPQQTMDSQGADPLFPLQKSAFEAVEWLFPIFVQRFLLRPFIITCERNGVAMFGAELRLFNSYIFDAGNVEFERLQKLKQKFEFKGYPLPIRRELEFAMNVRDIEQRTGALAKNDTLLISLAGLTGGSYSTSDDMSGRVSFIPTEESQKSLAISECSSSVRSLVELDYYIRHMSGKNDLLIIDEPELDLHPSNQRKFARLIARIVNAGTRVLVATHSDHFAREINSLIAAYSERDDVRRRNMKILQCNQDELMSSNDVSCYVITRDSITPMEIEPGFGYPIKSFDDDIQRFNDAYNELRSSIVHDEESEDCYGDS